VENDIEILTADALDYERFATLQRSAYNSRLSNLGVSNSYMNAEFYEWKFHPPAGPARVAVVRHGSEIISANSLIPLDLTFEGHIIRGWQCCDAATHPNARGKMYSPRCAKALMESLNNGEVLYVFPNEFSIRGISAIGIIPKVMITTWFRPVLLGHQKKDQNVSQVAGFDKAIDELTTRLGQKGDTMIFRSADYLNWRYAQHPINKYILFVYSEGEEKKGFAIVRIVHALGKELVVLMELWGDYRSVTRTLLRSILSWAAKGHHKFFIFQDNRMSLKSGFGYGFIPIPSFLLPKKQVLSLYAKQTDFMERIVESRWHIQWGDWDGF
jgi:hypothetical protein